MKKLFITGMLLFYFSIIFSQNVQELYYKEKYKEVINVADSLLKTDPANIDLYILKSKAFQQILQYQKSIEPIEHVLKQDSTNISAKIVLSFTYGKLKQYDKAITLAEDALKYDSLNISVASQVLNFYNITQDFVKANILLTRLLKNDSTNTYLLNEYAENQIRLGKIDMAKTYYEKSFSLFPNTFIALKLSNLLISKKDYKSAIDFTYSEYKRNAQPSLMRNIAYCYYLLDSTSKADSLFHLAELTGDTSTFVYKYAGICAYKLAKYPIACSYLEKAIRTDTTDVNIVYYLGSSLARNYAWDLGISYLNKALLLSLPNPQTLQSIYIELAQANLPKAQFNKAVEYYETAIKYAEKPYKIKYNIAEIYDYDLKDKKEAYNIYNDIYMKLLDKKGLTSQDSCVFLGCKFRIRELKKETFKK